MRKLTQRVLSFFVFSPSYTSKVPEQRLDESNVGHQMLKKMGELNSKGKKCVTCLLVHVTQSGHSEILLQTLLSIFTLYHCARQVEGAQSRVF